MNVLFIGGTGNISTAVSRLCLERGMSLTLLNRGARRADLPGARTLKADISRPEVVRAALGVSSWDAVVNWIAFTEADGAGAASSGGNTWAAPSAEAPPTCDGATAARSVLKTPIRVNEARGHAAASYTRRFSSKANGCQNAMCRYLRTTYAPCGTARAPRPRRMQRPSGAPCGVRARSS